VTALLADYEIVRLETMQFAQVGLAAGAAGWKAGHEVVRSGALVLSRTYTAMPDGLIEPELERAAKDYAADRARSYMHERIATLDLTPAQGARVCFAFAHAFMNGVLDEAARHSAPDGA
jgi:hypothetical protein